MVEHDKYILKCLNLAQLGLGKVAPNPMVACVIVYDGEIIGEGYHHKFGEAHAEVNAINSVFNKGLLEKSTLYVNLEPCSHFGKTPPCVDLILKCKIPQIIIGCVDPNSLVQGKGIERLINAGCEVKLGILEEECKEINKRFFTFHEKKRPFIILKWAQTKDGFIDSRRSKETHLKSMKISNETSQILVHQWRSEEQAIMIGTNTAILDNSKLTTRLWKGKNPLRIVLDKDLRIPSNFNLFDDSAPTLIFTAISIKSQKKLEYVKIDFNKNVPEQVLNELYKREIQSIIVEGGEQLLSSFIQNHLWDEARVFVAEKEILHGVKAPDFIQNPLHEKNIDGDKLLTYRNQTVTLNKL